MAKVRIKKARLKKLAKERKSTIGTGDGGLITDRIRNVVIKK